jgi:hypothetical protein
MNQEDVQQQQASVYQDLDDVETTWINLLAMWLELELLQMTEDDDIDNDDVNKE